MTNNFSTNTASNITKTPFLSYSLDSVRSQINYTNNWTPYIFISIVSSAAFLRVSNLRSEVKGSRVRVQLLDMCRSELSAEIARLMSKVCEAGGSGREGFKR